jgi:opacity protein-like surface antigen
MNRFRTSIVAISIAAVVVIVALAAGAAALAGAVGEPQEPAGAAAAASAGGHVNVATGGYHFSVDPNFNGGIFGTTTPIDNRLTFNAKLDADGSISGWFNYEQSADGSTFKFSGPVTCLHVYDTPVLTRTPDVPPLTQNRAKWGGRIEASNDPSSVGLYSWFQSIDNGEGANGWTDVSTLSGFGDEAANLAFCNSGKVPNPNFGPHPIGGGNIQVH